MSRRFAVLVGGLLLLGTTSVRAQDAISGQTYGAGVHAYFTGDYRRAHDLLTSAIATAASDPRFYYFRGLCYLKLGREDEAKQDFQKGAKLETTDPDKVYNVSKALERVQGGGRSVLEQYRAEARLLAFKRSEELRKARYEQLRREETRVLQQQATGAPGAAGQPAPTPPDVTFGEQGVPKPVPARPAVPGPEKAPGVAAPAVPAPPPEDPFATEPAKAPAAPTAPAGVKTPAPAHGHALEKKPLMEPKIPAKEVPPPEGVEADPFAMPFAPGPAPAAAKPPAAAKEPAAEADPFAPAPIDEKTAAKKALDKKAAEDAVVGRPEAAGTASKTKKPAAAKEPAEEGDLFAPSGAATKKSTPKKGPSSSKKAPAATEPAADEADPFATDAPPAAGKSSTKKATSTKRGTPKKAAGPAAQDAEDPFAADPAADEAPAAGKNRPNKK